MNAITAATPAGEVRESRRGSSGVIQFHETRILTRSFTLYDMHRDAHRVMGTDGVRNDWIFGWHDCEGVRELVIRTPEQRFSMSRLISVDMSKPVAFSLDVRMRGDDHAGERHARDCSATLAWLLPRLRGMNITVSSIHPSTSRLGKRRSRLRNVAFWHVEGEFTVINRNAAEAVLREGVGRMKGFGLGMIRVTPSDFA